MEKLYRLVWTETFRRTAKKWLKARPWMRATLSEVLHTLERNPDDPSLRLHPLHGALDIQVPDVAHPLVFLKYRLYPHPQPSPPSAS